MGRTGYGNLKHVALKALAEKIQISHHNGFWAVQVTNGTTEVVLDIFGLKRPATLYFNKVKDWSIARNFEVHDHTELIIRGPRDEPREFLKIDFWDDIPLFTLRLVFYPPKMKLDEYRKFVGHKNKAESDVLKFIYENEEAEINAQLEA